MGKLHAGLRPPQPIKLSVGAGEATGENASVSEHYVGAQQQPEGIDL